MRMLIKIISILLLLLLVVFSVLADMPLGRQLLNGLDLSVYIRLASLISLVIVAFLAWGYKHSVETSQKYRRADEAMTRADEAAARQQKTLEAAEKRLEAAFVEKEKGLDTQIEHATATLSKRVKVLKQQNLELKETVGKLMQALKRERLKKG